MEASDWSSDVCSSDLELRVWMMAVTVALALVASILYSVVQEYRSTGAAGLVKKPLREMGLAFFAFFEVGLRRLFVLLLRLVNTGGLVVLSVVLGRALWLMSEAGVPLWESERFLAVLGDWTWLGLPFLVLLAYGLLFLTALVASSPWPWFVGEYVVDNKPAKDIASGFRWLIKGLGIRGVPKWVWARTTACVFWVAVGFWLSCLVMTFARWARHEQPLGLVFVISTAALLAAFAANTRKRPATPGEDPSPPAATA
jgi:hypothetical protein